MNEMGRRAKLASETLKCVSGEEKNALLLEIKKEIEKSRDMILSANASDVEAAKEVIKPSMIDRLTLNVKRIDAICASLEKVASLPDPTGVFDGWVRPNGLVIKRTRVPFGVIGIIYESRPNVTADSASLCLKSGNAVILRGGKEALASNAAIVRCIRAALKARSLPEDCVQLIESADREYTRCLLSLRGYCDLIIPRGSASLINFVRDNSEVPVIETGAGNCHVYVHEDADEDMALRILINAKTQRPSVCNAAENLLVHESVAGSFLPKAFQALTERGVEVRCDEKALAILPEAKSATEEDFFTEYDDLIISVKVVSSLEEAISHINSHNTKHSETIVTRSIAASERFSLAVDAACVYTNASTRFTDGEEFGFGAEIGISTGKLHARGPMGLAELTCVKYVISGDGQCRS